MSKKWGILYHIGGRLRKEKGWSEKESDNPFWEGNGTWTLFDGSKFFGKWKNNRRWNGKSIDKEGNEIGKFVNGEEEIYYKPPF